MENGSKAILIAGSVILVLILITIAMVIFYNAQGTLGVAGVQIDNIAIQEYNAQYLAYDKEYVTGMEVKECISQVLYNNANSRDPAVFVTGVTVQNAKNSILKYITITTNSKKDKIATKNNNTALSKIDNSSRYTTTINIGEDGLVYEIKFIKI